MLDQPRVHFDNGGRKPTSRPVRQKNTEPAVRQRSRVLWVVLELDDVDVSIGAANEMALGATAHSADVMDRIYCHEIFRFWR
jgi:hypothetical protein